MTEATAGAGRAQAGGEGAGARSACRTSSLQYRSEGSFRPPFLFPFLGCFPVLVTLPAQKRGPPWHVCGEISPLFL